MRVLSVSPRLVVPVFVCGAIVLVWVLKSGIEQGFWIGCLWYRFTGIQCPGCGNTRAMMALFRGDLIQAWRYNLVGFPAVLIGAAVYSRSLWISFVRREWVWPRFSNKTGWILLIVAISWMVLRNLPWELVFG